MTIKFSFFLFFGFNKGINGSLTEFRSQLLPFLPIYQEYKIFRVQQLGGGGGVLQAGEIVFME